MSDEIAIEVVQQAFRQAGHHVPSKKRAQAILDALPAGAAATGWTQAEVLDVCVENYAGGAVERLLGLERDRERRRKRRP